MWKRGDIKLIFKHVKSTSSLVKSALIPSESPSDLSAVGRLMSIKPQGGPSFVTMISAAGHIITVTAPACGGATTKEKDVTIVIFL